MIQIRTQRFGLFVVAATVNDYGEISLAVGLTAASASRRVVSS